MILVWGEVLWDRFPHGDELGGAPANVAWHLAGLGAAVELVTRVGDDDDGRRALARLGARGVGLALAQLDGGRATGEVTIAVEGGEPRYTLVPDRAWEHIAMTEAIGAALPGARAIVYGTLAQRTPDGRAALEAALAAASPRVLRVCDPNLRPAGATRPDDDRALAHALGAADVVKLGEREAIAIGARLGHADVVGWLLGRGAGATKHRDDAHPAAAPARGARLVVITRGAAGSTWHAPGLVLEVPAIAARPGGDNVGCGDAFVAALVHGLVAGWPWARIARVASALAAEVAGARGATPAIDGAALAAAIALEAT